MRRFASERVEKVGLPPGTIVHVGEERAERVRITVIDYSETECDEREAEAHECWPPREGAAVTWINVDGVHDVEALRQIGEVFGLHPLLLEDIAHTTQRPKTEDYGDYLFAVVKMLLHEGESSEIGVEQVSLVLGPNYVLSFQERPGDVFEAVRERLRGAKGRIRKEGADYLAYSLVDAIVDHYFLILEEVGDKLEALEDELVSDPAPDTPRAMHRMKSDVLFLRRCVWPLREVISSLARGDSPLIQQGTIPYLRDVYDHTIQVVDTIESLRDIISGMLDTYLSLLSNRMNEVMKVLTIIATIFIPLTFIAGLYGMNFKWMPELEWHWGYPASLLVMVVVALLMVAYFRRKTWL